MNRKLFWLHLEVHKVAQGAFNVHHDPHVLQVKGHAHLEIEEGHWTHQINYHEHEVVLDDTYKCIKLFRVLSMYSVHHNHYVPHVQGQAHEEVLVAFCFAVG
jgi:hypothetical protein